VGANELASKLGGHALAKTVMLVQTLEQGNLRRFERLFINHWLHTPRKVLALILAVDASDQVARF